MLFSSMTFIGYFLPIVLIGYYGCFFSRTLQNMWLLVGSLLFYAWGEPYYVVLMLLSIGVNYLFARGVHYCQEKQNRGKILLIATIIFNVGILVVFKYSGFIVENLNAYFGFNLQVPAILLPIGISFFTFQALSYVIDVYRKEVNIDRNIFSVALYIAFFPQLVAGPIVRYKDIAKQIKERKENFRKIGIGTCRFTVGLGKKLIIANQMAIVADRIFEVAGRGGIPASLAWLGAIAYTLQIYYDFSSYSDMAIGLALLFGFQFNENFCYPYISKSISEFWRRWHISLGTWFKEYVYFPLGGSRVTNKDKMVRNLLVVWILTGVWHGAAWTFLIWGLFNFLCILIEKFFEIETKNGKPFFRHLYALTMILIGWVLFRSPTLSFAKNYFSSMFNWSKNGVSSEMAGMFLREFWLFFVLAIIFATPIARKVNYYLVNTKAKIGVLLVLYPIGILFLFTICLMLIITGSYNPFIYFNF